MSTSAHNAKVAEFALHAELCDLALRAFRSPYNIEFVHEGAQLPSRVLGAFFAWYEYVLDFKTQP